MHNKGFILCKYRTFCLKTSGKVATKSECTGVIPWMENSFDDGEFILLNVRIPGRNYGIRVIPAFLVHINKLHFLLIKHLKCSYFTSWDIFQIKWIDWLILMACQLVSKAKFILLSYMFSTLNRLDLGVMATMRFLKIPRYPELKPHHQMRFSAIPKTLRFFSGAWPSAGVVVGAF